MTLSDQAMGCIMVLLQKSLMEQSDIVPMLKSLDFQNDLINVSGELIVTNPPTNMFMAKESSDESLRELQEMAAKEKED